MNDGRLLVVRIHVAVPWIDNLWYRFERNVYADLKAAQPTNNVTAIHGIEFWHHDIRVDSVRLSNSLTSEHNSLAPGAIGHIVRNRTIDTSTMAATDRFFHYDQVGSVHHESASNGSAAQKHWQDSFGNTMQDWQTAHWSGDKAGWHHNTKEYDADVEMVYMYQRWYDSRAAVFMTIAPNPPQSEHPYSFAEQSPLRAVDPRGEAVVWDESCCVKSYLITDNEIITQVNATITDVDMAECIKDKISEGKYTVKCSAGTADPTCSSTNKPKAYNKDGVITMCEGVMGQSCGKFDKINILIHEMAHSCGFDPDHGNKQGIGIPGEDGNFTCTGK